MYVEIPEHFRHQPVYDVGSQVSSLLRHKPVEGVHFLPSHGHHYVRGKPEMMKKRSEIEIQNFNVIEYFVRKLATVNEVNTSRVIDVKLSNSINK